MIASDDLAALKHFFPRIKITAGLKFEIEEGITFQGVVTLILPLADPLLFLGGLFLFGDLDVVYAHRASEEIAVTDDPDILPLEIERRREVYPLDCESFCLAENIAVQRLPIDLSLLQDLGHEGIQVPFGLPLRRRGLSEHDEDKDGVESIAHG